MLLDQALESGRFSGKADLARGLAPCSVELLTRYRHRGENRD
jgi:hypothetical protein